jgi:hypothetical protein
MQSADASQWDAAIKEEYNSRASLIAYSALPLGLLMSFAPPSRIFVFSLSPFFVLSMYHGGGRIYHLDIVFFLVCFHQQTLIYLIYE